MVDQKLIVLINQEWTAPALDQFMAALSALDVWFWPLAVLGVVIALTGGFTARVFLLATALAVAVNDGVVAKTLKRIVDRPRPHQALNNVRQVDLAKARPRMLALVQPAKVKNSRASLEDVDGRSFPSSHTMNTFSAALVCAVFYRCLGWLAFIPASLVAYSRIYTGSHWPSDIVVSVVLALGVTLFVLASLEMLWRIVAPRWAPELGARHPSLFIEPPPRAA